MNTIVSIMWISVNPKIHRRKPWSLSSLEFFVENKSATRYQRTCITCLKHIHRNPVELIFIHFCWNVARILQLRTKIDTHMPSSILNLCLWMDRPITKKTQRQQNSQPVQRKTLRQWCDFVAPTGFFGFALTFFVQWTWYRLNFYGKNV